MSDDIQKSIQEHNANKRLHILKGFSDLSEISKGHMDFAGGKQPSNPNLVKKQITDKRGHQTTRWTKNGEDEKPQKEGSSADKHMEQYKDNKSLIDQPMSDQEAATHAQQTQSDQLKLYINKYASDESKSVEVNAAKAELENRGEANDMVELERGEEMGTGTESMDIDFNNPEMVADYINENRDAIIEQMMADQTLNAISAAKIHYAGSSQNNSETHAKIDAAQAALEDLKNSLGGGQVGVTEEDMAELSEYFGENAAIFVKENIDPEDLDHFYDFMHENGPQDFKDEEKVFNMFEDYMQNEVGDMMSNGDFDKDDEDVDQSTPPPDGSEEDEEQRRLDETEDSDYGDQDDTEDEEMSDDEIRNERREIDGDEDEEDEDEWYDEEERKMFADGKTIDERNKDKEDFTDEEDEDFYNEIGEEDEEDEDVMGSFDKKGDVNIGNNKKSDKKEDEDNGNSVINDADPKEVESLRNAYKNMAIGQLKHYATDKNNDDLSQALLEEEIAKRNTSNKK